MTIGLTIIAIMRPHGGAKLSVFAAGALRTTDAVALSELTSQPADINAVRHYNSRSGVSLKTGCHLSRQDFRFESALSRHR
jgi:hypothetical protein